MKPSIYIVALLLVGISSCMNCRDDAPDSSRKHGMIDGVKKASSEQKKLIEQADRGDAKAASALGEHFFLVENDYEAAKHWFRKAAEHGGAKEKEVYQSYLDSMKEFDESDN
jgi:TPR repeat protein